VSDFGTDVGNTTAHIGANVVVKIFEAMQTLVSKIFDTWAKYNSPEMKLAKKELNELKREIDKEEYISKISNMKGYVKYKEAEKAGITLANSQILLTSSDFKRLAELCKRNGVFLTGTMDARENELNDIRKFNVMCKQTDVERMTDMVKLLKDELLIESYTNKYNEIMGKGSNNLTQQDLVDAAEINRKIAEIKRGYAYELNNIQADRVYEKVVNGTETKGMSFDEALNRNTGRMIDKDVYSVIADASDPAKHIICHGYMEEFRGQPYIKTNYEVFDGDDKVFFANDGRFEGRPLGYWETQKNDMKVAGGFSDTVSPFNSTDEYQAYLNDYVIQNDKGLSFLNIGSDSRNYNGIIDILNKQLDEHGAYYEDGIVYNRDSGVATNSINADKLSPTDKTSLAEAIVIGKQIDIYKSIASHEAEYLVAKSNLLAQPENTPAYNTAKNIYDEISAKHRAVVESEYGLYNDRRIINSVMAEQRNRVSEIEGIPLYDPIRQDKDALLRCRSDIFQTQKKIADISYKIANDAYNAGHEDLYKELDGYRNALQKQEGSYAGAIEKYYYNSNLESNYLSPNFIDSIKAINADIEKKEVLLSAIKAGIVLNKYETGSGYRDRALSNFESANVELSELYNTRDTLRAAAITEANNYVADNGIDVERDRLIYKDNERIKNYTGHGAIPDDRRSERVDEVNDKRHALSEYTGMVKDMKVDGGVKPNDFRDKQINRTGLHKGNITTKGNTERL